MQKFRLKFQTSLLLLSLSVISIGAFTPFLNAKAGNASIKAGTKIFFSVGGEGCNCRGAASGTADASGSATVQINLNGCHPNDKCKTFATAADESSGKKYKGNGSISSTAGGNYASTFSLSAY
jgi:hypothetical protein